MMMLSAALLLTLMALPVAQGQRDNAVVPRMANMLPLTLPESVQGEPGDFITVRAETAGVRVQWYSVDRGLKLFPSQFLNDPKVTVAVALVPGNYRLLAWTAINDVPTEAALVVVKIGGAPVPPGPDPPPKPPPDPPKPPVPPTPPVDTPFVAQLRAALALESESDKACLTALRDVYRRTANQAANNGMLTLVKQVRDYLILEQRANVGDKLPNVRRVIVAELNTSLPRALDAPLDIINRRLCSEAFTKVADGLDAILSAQAARSESRWKTPAGRLKSWRENIDITEPENMTIAERADWWERNYPELAK